MPNTGFYPIDVIVDGVKNYGHFGCYAPLEAYYIGSWCIVDVLVLSAIPLVFATMFFRQGSLYIRALVFSHLTLVCLLIWAFFGTLCMIVNLISGNDCMEAYMYILLSIWQIPLNLLGWLYFSALRKSWQEGEFENKLINDLISFYVTPSQPINETPEELVAKYQTILHKFQVFDIEKRLIQSDFTTNGLANSQDAGQCLICLAEITSKSNRSQIACIHEFHYECLMTWFKIKPECPACKLNFRKGLLLKLHEKRTAESKA